MRSSWIVLTLLVLFAVGCNGNDSERDDGGSVMGPSVDDELTGTFVGTIHNASFSLQFKAILDQNASQVEGEWSLPTDVFDVGMLVGSVSVTGFTGTMSVDVNCTGQPAQLAGNRDTTALVWTSPGFNGSCSSLFPGGAFTITMHEQ